MHNLYFFIGLSNPHDLHKMIVKEAKEKGEGAFYMLINSDNESGIKKLENVIFAKPPDFQIEHNTKYDPIYMENAPLPTIMRDTNHEYCVIAKINQWFIGHKWIPFDQPEKLQHFISDVITAYGL